MSANLGERPWMRAAAPVLDALEAEGGPDCARFVGGCVRNAVMGRPITDVDIATRLTPERTIAALSAAGLGAHSTGVEHGTVTAVLSGTPYEVTTLRRDVETDGRRAVVAFTQDWAEDAARRDFRLNALYADRSGAVFDPTGEGLADAKAGRIVFVGEAETRIREDYLRILRFFRLHAVYGRGAPDAEGLRACATLTEGLGRLSAERVSAELLKLLAADDPRDAVRLMAASGVLGAVLPTAGLARFERLVAIETEQLFESDPELRLAALLPSDPAEVAGAAERLRLSNALRDRLLAALPGAVRIVSWLGPREVRRAVYRLGAQPFRDQVKLAWAADPRAVTTPQWRGLLMLGATWTPPALPVTGDQVLGAGVPKGPLVGQVLREVEDWWVDLDFIDDPLSAMERLKAVAQGLAY